MTALGSAATYTVDESSLTLADGTGAARGDV